MKVRLSTVLWELLHPFDMFKVRVRKPLASLLSRLLIYYKNKTKEKVNNTRELVFKAGLISLLASIVIWLSIFMYIAFYYAYIPNIRHIRPVHFQYRSCGEKQGICSFPSAHIQLTKKHDFLMVGQVYKININLEMPESNVNKNLGMFMVCAELQSHRKKIVGSSCRSGILPYRSFFLHTIKSFIMVPMMLLGSYHEKQNIQLELFSSFEDDQNQPVTGIFIEVQSQHIQFYSASLQIDAHFSGLRYMMFNWPYLSATIGISTNLLFLALICALSCHHLQVYINEEEKNTEIIVDEINEEKASCLLPKNENSESTSIKQEEEYQTSEDNSVMEESIEEDIIKIEDKL